MDTLDDYVFLDFMFNNIKAGRVVIKLFKNIVPRSAENFRALCTGEKGQGTLQKPLHYKGTKINKVISQCMVQGGDIINDNGTSGESIYGECFEAENFIMQHDKPGLVGMMNNVCNKISSQFYITTVPCYHLDNSNVIIGEVIKGFDIIVEMSEIPRCNDIPLENISIVDCGQLNTNEPWNINENDGTDIYPSWPNDLDYQVDKVQIINIVNNINQSGNIYYKKHQYLESERKYKKAIRYLDWYKNKHQNDILKLKHSVLLNLTASQLNIDKNKEALEHCNEVLMVNPNYGKAYYRRAKAKFALQEYDDALSDVRKASKLHPGNKYINQLFDIIKTKKQLYTKKEKQFCLNAFKSVKDYSI